MKDLPEEAVQLYLDRLRSVEGSDRLWAAQWLGHLAYQVRVDRKILTDDILPVLIAFLRSNDRNWREMAGYSVPALAQHVEIDEAIVLKAHRAAGTMPQQD